MTIFEELRGRVTSLLNIKVITSPIEFLEKGMQFAFTGIIRSQSNILDETICENS